jgi:NTP pyrophosphatase (non-canonical NTP hydrolase)
MAFRDLAAVAAALRAFAAERDWDRFHTPRNLATALSVGASEALEHFQWLTDEEGRNLGAEKKQAVALELADVFLYLVRLSDRLGVDLLEAAERKMAINAENYPADYTRGAIRKKGSGPFFPESSASTKKGS